MTAVCFMLSPIVQNFKPISSHVETAAIGCPLYPDCVSKTVYQKLRINENAYQRIASAKQDSYQGIALAIPQVPRNLTPLQGQHRKSNSYPTLKPETRNLFHSGCFATGGSYGCSSPFCAAFF